MGSDDVGRPADRADAESAARLRAIAERTPDVLYAIRLEPDIAVEYVSPACTDLIGVTPEELYADPMTLVRHLHPEDRHALAGLTSDPGSYAGGVTVRWVLPDGSVRWSEHRSGGRRREDGSLVLEGVARDVTQARADREALHRSAELFRLAVREAPIGMGLVSLDGRFVQVNDALCDFFHRDEAELLTMSFEDLTEPDDLAVERDLLAGLMAGTRDSYRLTKRFRAADGSTTHGELQVSLLRDSAGEPQFLLGQIVDITETVRALAALTDSEEQFRLLAENSSDLVVRTDVDGVVQWVSPSVREVLGHDPVTLVGRPAIELVYPDDRGTVPPPPRLGDTANDPDGPVTREVRFVTADGRPRWMAVRRGVLRDDDGRPIAVVGAARDIDDEIHARTALEQSERKFRLAMSVAAAGMVLVDPTDLRFLQVNAAFGRMLGRDEEWLLAHRVHDVMHPDDQDASRAVRERLLSGESEQETHERRFLRADGSVIWTLVANAALRGDDGRPMYLIGHIVDITESRQLQAELAHRASHDTLTGFANREQVHAVLADLVDRTAENGSGVALLYADLDNFKVVNDSLGHVAGDRVLSAVADRVRSAVRPHDTVGRVGGDEFVVVLDGVRSLAEAQDVAERIRASVRQELEVAGHRLRPSISIGVTYAALGASADEVLRDADTALYQAKERGRDQWVVFDEGMRADAVARLTVEAELRAALDDDTVVAYTMPVVRLADGAPAGLEALVRWDHPIRGVLSPADFLDVAEASGLIVPLGRRMLEQACRLIAGDDISGSVSVNVSAVELMRAGWAASVREVLDETGADPRRLVVEVTETAILRMSVPTRAELSGLVDLGIRFMVDDFGTGFSSIAHLRDLPVMGVKLDRSFTAGLTDHDSPANRLAEGIAGLVRGLGLVGVAEGVETAEQARLLAGMGWEYGQGYLYGPPAPAPRDRSAG